ncbi:hypothetical protein [Desulfomonile tiedjei]|uniref:hypothetical protein n=1 Tax=Desulfomonile tiedjei TaxID=2358 RepID=UPI00031F70AE|nr:hypothetical protein [Desulfomonile tiedjei]
MQQIRPFQIAIVFLLSLACAVESGIAGDFGFDSHKYWFVYETAIFYLTTIVVECLVAYAFLRWPRKTTIHLFFWILVINVITSPIAPFGPFILKTSGILKFGDNTPAIMLISEFIVGFLEWVFLYWICTRMRINKVIDEHVTEERAFLIVLVGNIASLGLTILFACLLHRMLFSMYY